MTEVEKLQLIAALAAADNAVKAATAAMVFALIAALGNMIAIYIFWRRSQ